MSISFKGIGENVITFKTETAVASSPVTVSANDTVSDCASGDDFCGVAISVVDSLAAVQMSGYVELPYTGTAPTIGYCSLVADGNGGVKTSADGRSFLVLNVNTTASKVGFII